MNTVATPSVRNITRLFRTATDAQITAGADWYREANAYAVELATEFRTPVSVAAGVIAATSPLNSWVANKRLARRVMASAGYHVGGYLGDGLRKANAIILGADPIVSLKGEKVTAFYLGIISSGQTDAVCVDRHAWSLAVNIRYPEGNIPTLKGKRYASAVAAYRRAAAILSREYGTPLSAAQVQAVTWVLWRNKFWAEGAWD